MTPLQNFYSGALAGVFTAVVVVPSDRIKCLLQVQARSGGLARAQYGTPISVIKKLYNGV